MNIKFLSACCGGSERAKAELEAIIKEMGITATIETINDMKTIIKYGVMKFPAIAINEKVKVMGRVPSKAEMIKYIQEELNS